KKLLGMISLSDIRRAKMKGELEKLAQDFSSRNVIALYEDQTVDEAINILNRKGIKRAPVLDSPESGILVGILSKTDELRSFERQKFKRLKKED
ncbi:MAG: CBS domain-containing protein, partial [Candidatus Heimdallarchaeota archaeon]